MSKLLRRDDCLLLLVDVQERLAAAMPEREQVIGRCRLLAEAARRLAVPVIASEQYPKGLGPTVPGLAASLGNAPRLEKLSFSCALEPAIVEAVRASGRRTLVLGGMEAHVCVLQTALGFRALGAEVAVVADAVASRREESRILALERLREAGCQVVDCEMVLFEWLERAGTPEFKAISPWIRDGLPP
ncbi:MAG: isochorismatase family protein [Geminicoccaceae bacterium]|nr:isochorismatase family protein [Geminicoccaceae bacterium]MDW8370370.1 isochorismatase family protein [Geminicoccaceae bacterium]